MPVVEFKKHGVVGQPKRRQIPEFIQGSADFYNPADHTYVGWVSSKGDYYVPDTIVHLTKQDFVDRMLRIHAIQPLQKNTGADEYGAVGGPFVTMTDEEVATYAESSYDYIVEHCTAQDNS